MNEKLYQAILDRKAIRQYQKEPLSNQLMEKIKTVSDNINSLKSKTKASFYFMDTPDKLDIVASMGGYGRILNAPHFVIPTIKETSQSLLELGFQTQQFVNLITSLGVSSCYIGALHRDKNNIYEKFEISKDKAIAAAVIFGNKNQTRKPTEPSLRKPLHEIFYQVDLDTPIIPDDPTWTKILNAARRAPSAGNAQPWRMIILDDELTIYADPQAYIPLFRKAGKTYAIHDIGILMANIHQATKSVDWECQWELFDGISEDTLVYGNWTPVSKAKIVKSQ